MSPPSDDLAGWARASPAEGHADRMDRSPVERDSAWAGLREGPLLKASAICSASCLLSCSQRVHRVGDRLRRGGLARTFRVTLEPGSGAQVPPCIMGGHVPVYFHPTDR